MKPKTNGTTQRNQRLNRVQGEGPNWVLIAGAALLSTLSIRIGCTLKQAFDARRANSASNALKENGKCVSQRKHGTCKLHSNLYCYTQEDACYHCASGEVNTNPTSKDGDPTLPLVKVPTHGPNKDDTGVMWASSPDRLELPRKPFHHSNCSDSPPFSESGSDMYSKREVIQKLRQQLKRRDDMIMDMQTSLSAQMAHSAHLQAQLDAANRDLFDSEREILRLRKAIADRCMVESTNGYVDDVELSAKVKELEQKLASQVLDIF